MSPIRVSQSDACTICHASYLTKNEHNGLDDCVQLACSHIFHEYCLKQWCDINPSCPLCRRSIVIHSLPGMVCSFQPGAQSRFSIIVLRTLLAFLLCFQLTATVNLTSDHSKRDFFLFAHYVASLLLMVISTIVLLDFGSESKGELYVLRRGTPHEEM
jgi:hypothetical protein